MKRLLIVGTIALAACGGGAPSEAPVSVPASASAPSDAPSFSPEASALPASSASTRTQAALQHAATFLEFLPTIHDPGVIKQALNDEADWVTANLTKDVLATSKLLIEYVNGFSAVLEKLGAGEDATAEVAAWVAQADAIRKVAGETPSTAPTASVDQSCVPTPSGTPSAAPGAHVPSIPTSTPDALRHAGTFVDNLATHDDPPSIPAAVSGEAKWLGDHLTSAQISASPTLQGYFNALFDVYDKLLLGEDPSAEVTALVGQAAALHAAIACLSD